jgi:hypothetical protein
MDSILISTRVKDTIFPADNSTANCSNVLFTTNSNCVPSRNISYSTRYYTDDIESYTIYIEHSVYVRMNQASYTNTALKGKLLYSDGSGREVIFDDPTREGDIFTIQTLIDAAGVPSLDVASGLVDDTASLRYDGLALVCVVDYSNSASHPTDLSYTYTLFVIRGVNVISQEPSTAVPDGVLQRSWYGVRVTFVISGTLGKFDFPTLLTSVVSGLVLVKIATTIVDLLLTYALPERIEYRKHKYEVTKGFKEMRGSLEIGREEAPQQPAPA